VGEERALNRRALLASGAGVAALAVLGGRAAPALSRPRLGQPLWQTAQANGIIYGSALASWQTGDTAYNDLVNREAAMIWTQDDFLWYTLKPTPTSPLDFTAADSIVSLAEAQRQLVFGAFLVWDEGFGDGWSDDDLWGLSRDEAQDLLYPTITAMVSRYAGRIPAWVCCNEVVGTSTTEGDGDGLRTDVPWYNTIGPDYVPEAFRVAHAADPSALLYLNDFGFETDSQYGDKAAAKRRATLKVLDRLLADGVPVHGLGIQAHLIADGFDELFDARAYRRFLADVASRGLTIAITEMDVLDDGLPPDVKVRDAAVAEIYARYLDAALSETDVKIVLNFGLSDRYTSLDEDVPRDDGAHRRALPWNRQLKTKPAYTAIQGALAAAPSRTQLLPLLR
jgi:endo-1,4-beta-xylanase